MDTIEERARALWNSTRGYAEAGFIARVIAFAREERRAALEDLHRSTYGSNSKPECRPHDHCRICDAIRALATALPPPAPPAGTAAQTKARPVDSCKCGRLGALPGAWPAWYEGLLHAPDKCTPPPAAQDVCTKCGKAVGHWPACPDAPAQSANDAERRLGEARGGGK